MSRLPIERLLLPAVLFLASRCGNLETYRVRDLFGELLSQVPKLLFLRGKSPQRFLFQKDTASPTLPNAIQKQTFKSRRLSASHMVPFAPKLS